MQDLIAPLDYAFLIFPHRQAEQFPLFSHERKTFGTDEAFRSGHFFLQGGGQLQVVFHASLFDAGFKQNNEASHSDLLLL